MPSISVIIPAYNYGRFLREAVESAISQTLAPLEIVVVDDGSTDETADVLTSFGDSIVVVSEANRGVAFARNIGVARSSGDLLAFLDADDAWAPNKLELQAARFAEEPDLGLIHCGLTKIDAAGRATETCLDGSEGSVALEMLRECRSVILAGGSGALIPRATFDAVGGFDDRLSTSADWDLFYRIARVSRVGFVPLPLYRYRLHGSNMHRNARRLERDMLLVYDKAFGSATISNTAFRNACYGRLHAVLAGAFFAEGDARNFLHNALASVAFAPSNAFRFGALPALRLREFFAARAGRARDVA